MQIEADDNTSLTQRVGIGQWLYLMDYIYYKKILYLETGMTMNVPVEISHVESVIDTNATPQEPVAIGISQ